MWPINTAINLHYHFYNKDPHNLTLFHTTLWLWNINVSFGMQTITAWQWRVNDVVRFLTSTLLKEFWKSVNIWWSYETMKLGGLVFMDQYHPINETSLVVMKQSARNSQLTLTVTLRLTASPTPLSAVQAYSPAVLLCTLYTVSKLPSSKWRLLITGRWS